MSLAPPLMPPLSLTDIMHPIPPLQRDRPQNSPLPESLHEHDIAQIRARALEMGLGTEGSNTQPTPRERELLDMVLRLTNPEQPLLDPSQLLHQADTISGLIQQREYLAQRVEEEKSRWESEKAGWDRISEALLVHRHRKVRGPDDSELKRISQSLEYENTALKDKLNQTQGRINALETELSKLKPHLLMQPFVPRPVSSSPAAGSVHTSPIAAIPPTDSEVEMILDDTPSVPSRTQVVLTDQTPGQPPSLHSLAQASSYFSSLSFPSIENVDATITRKRKLAAQLKKALLLTTTTPASQNNNSARTFPTPPANARTVHNASQSATKKAGRPGKSSRRAPPQLLVSDARAEHLLIAARRLGRERAGIVAGVISAERERAEREKAGREKERIEREKERIEREKKNRGGGGYYRDRAERGVSGPAVDGTPTPGRDEESNNARYANAMAGYVNAAGTPTKGESKTAKSDAKGKGKAVPIPLSTTTPLDSLLSAARSIQETSNGAKAEGPSASTSSASTRMVTRRRAANPSEQPDSASPPKRRKLSNDTSNSPTRARTALDVLADQAAVVGVSDAPPEKRKGRGKRKGKALSTADEMATSADPPVKRKRGRPPNKDRLKAAPPPSAALVVGVAVDNNAGSANATASGSASTTAGENGASTRPVTRWVQRGRLATSLRAPPREKDDVESEEDSAEAGVEIPPSMETVPEAAPVAEPVLQELQPQDEMQDVQPTTVVTLPPPAVQSPALAPAPESLLVPELPSGMYEVDSSSAVPPLSVASAETSAPEPNVDALTSTPIVTPQLVVEEVGSTAIEEFLPAADEVLTAADEVLPAADEMLPSVDETLPPTEDVVPVVDEALHGPDEALPPIDEVPPPTEEVVPVVGEVLHGPDEALPPVDEVPPPTEEVVPVVDEVLHGPDEALPPIDEVTPPIDEVTPPIDEVTPPIDEVTPPIDEVTPSIDEVLPAPNEVLHAPDETLHVPDALPVPGEVVPVNEAIPMPHEVAPSTTALNVFADISSESMFEDPVLDADADGESDPDIDMDANTHL